MPEFHWLTWAVIGAFILFWTSLFMNVSLSPGAPLFMYLVGPLYWFFLLAAVWVVICMIAGWVKGVIDASGYARLKKLEARIEELESASLR